MAKLIYWMNCSVDGYVEDAEGSINWSDVDEGLNAYINDIASSVGTHLYGRKMYEAMAYWETDYAAHNHSQVMLDWAKLWQASDKIVYSKTLAQPRSARTRIEREFDADAVRRLKADAGRDMTISGAEIAAPALKAGLVDELHIFVWSVVVGGGKRFFPDGVRLNLELVSERTFRNGVIAVHYTVRR